MISQYCFYIRDITIITIKNFDYCCIIYNRISEALNLLESAVLKNQGYIYIYIYICVYIYIYIYIILS